MNKKLIGGAVLLGGIGVLVLVSRQAKAAETGILQQQHQDKVASAIAACPPGDRDCVMRIRYAAEGRDWDAESDPEYRRERELARQEAEVDRIRRLREEQWSHL